MDTYIDLKEFCLKENPDLDFNKFECRDGWIWAIPLFGMEPSKLFVVRHIHSSFEDRLINIDNIIYQLTYHIHPALGLQFGAGIRIVNLSVL
jgi:hypothetical protein